MSSETILYKTKKYYEGEYKDLKKCYEQEFLKDCLTKAQLLDKTLQRMLGVAFFVQELDVEFNDIDSLYEEYKAKATDLYNQYTS